MTSDASSSNDSPSNSSNDESLSNNEAETVGEE